MDFGGWKFIFFKIEFYYFLNPSFLIKKIHFFQNVEQILYCAFFISNSVRCVFYDVFMFDLVFLRVGFRIDWKMWRIWADFTDYFKVFRWKGGLINVWEFPSCVFKDFYVYKKVIGQVMGVKWGVWKKCQWFWFMIYINKS